MEDWNIRSLSIRKWTERAGCVRDSPSNPGDRQHQALTQPIEQQLNGYVNGAISCLLTVDLLEVANETLSNPWRPGDLPPGVLYMHTKMTLQARGSCI